MVDVGDVVGLIFAVTFGFVMLFSCYLLVRLSRTVDALTKLDLPAGVDVEIKVE